MIKKYDFNYDFHKASCEFEVDLDKFTDEHAKSTLTFFLWDYDEEENPIDEVMKKYAMECIRVATFNNCNKFGVIDEFNNKEGFGKLNGEIGVTLTYIEGLEFDDNDLDMKIIEN